MDQAHVNPINFVGQNRASENRVSSFRKENRQGRKAGRITNLELVPAQPYVRYGTVASMVLGYTF